MSNYSQSADAIQEQLPSARAELCGTRYGQTRPARTRCTHSVIGTTSRTRRGAFLRWPRGEAHARDGHLSDARKAAISRVISRLSRTSFNKSSGAACSSSGKIEMYLGHSVVSRRGAQTRSTPVRSCARLDKSNRHTRRASKKGSSTYLMPCFSATARTRGATSCNACRGNCGKR